MSPLLAAAVALAGGDLLGLWVGGSAAGAGLTARFAAADALMILVGLAAASRVALPLRSELRRSRFASAFSRLISSLPATPAILLIAVFGYAAGRGEGAASVRSCVSELRGGEDLAARGLVMDPIPVKVAGEHRRAVNVRLASPLLAYGGRTCTIARLRARVWPGDARVSSGSMVALRGVWRPLPDAGRLPSPPARRGYLQAELLAADDGRGWHHRPKVGDRLTRLAARLRESAGRRLEASLAPDVVDTGKALVLADRVSLDPRVRRRFTDAGIGHLLAISGLHIGALAGGVLWCLGLWLRDGRRYVIAVVATGLYVLLIGAPPSAVRAFLLFAGYAAARLRHAPASIGDLAGLAAVFALLVDPLVLLHPSFQLSFAGFTGIVTGRGFVQRLTEAIDARSRRRMQRGWRSGITALIGSFAAFLFTAPFAAAHFGRVVPAAIISSIPGATLVALALPSLILTLGLPVWLADWPAAAATCVLRLLDGLAARFAALPLHWDAPPLGSSGWLILAAIVTSLAFLHARRRIGAIVVAAATCAASIAAPVFLRLRDRGKTVVCSLDVGQGDAAVIRTRRGRWILIDGGPGSRFLAGSPASRPIRSDPRYGDAGFSTIVPFLRARGAREVELFVLSHPHLDHFGGSAAVFDAFRVHHVLDPGFPEPNPAYLAFLDRLHEEGARWLPARAGFRARIDDVELLVLWPPSGAVKGGANEHSAVVRLRAPGLGYLNSGDAPAAVEASILEQWPRDSLAVRILKLGHHGSRTSTSLAWLRAVRPEIAVISAGRGNSHGHPHPVTLARLDSARVRTVWRTDERGSLCVEAEAVDERAGGLTASKPGL